MQSPTLFLSIPVKQLFPSWAMYPSISNLKTERREKHSIVSSLNGTLLLSKSSFPYFMLIALEAGGPIRALFLLLVSPIIWVVECFSESGAVQIQTFFAMVGLRVANVKGVAKAVLPRFYLENLHCEAYKVFSSCGGKKCVVTSSPRIMVEPFLREYLDVDNVVGTEVWSLGGYCLGFAVSPGVLVGVRKSRALRATIGHDEVIDIGLGSGPSDYLFMSLCKEGYLVPKGKAGSALPREDYPKPLIFHDGRLVASPTPFNFLAVILWLPLGFTMAIARLLVGLVLPYKFGLLGAAATGFRIRANFSPLLHTCETYNSHHVSHARASTHCAYNTCSPMPLHTSRMYISRTHHTSEMCYIDTCQTCHWCDIGMNCPCEAYASSIPCTCDGHTRKGTGTLYVCSHRTLIDPVIVATALQRPLAAVTYSVSRVSEMMSPIRTFRLSRDRFKDGQMMRELLKQGDLVVCPEGTTCREPYLLRFSPLFAEVTDVIVPVAVDAHATMFHGTTTRGYKWLDSFFFLMNPTPNYRLQFLGILPEAHTCANSWKSSHEVANHVQKEIARALSFECTNFTRRDKYRMLAGNDGMECKG